MPVTEHPGVIAGWELIQIQRPVAKLAGKMHQLAVPYSCTGVVIPEWQVRASCYRVLIQI
jgi:hypothetical protein